MKIALLFLKKCFYQAELGLLICVLALPVLAKIPPASPSSDFVEPQLDSENFDKGIFESYESKGFSFSQPQLNLIHLSGPFGSGSRSEFIIKNGFEDPDVIYVKIPTPLGEFDFYSVIPHQGLDLVSSAVSEHPHYVYAPTEGYLLVRSYDLENEESRKYGTALTIYNPTTQTVLVLLHALPLESVGDTPIWVSKGQLIGELAEVAGVDPEHSSSIKHIHMYILSKVKNGTSQSILISNPWNYFRSIFDHKGPLLDDVYIYTDQATRQSNIPKGKFDLIVKTHDVIDGSEQWVAPAEFSYLVQDDKGREIAKATSCRPENFLNYELKPGWLSIYQRIYDLKATLDEDASETFMPGKRTAAWVPHRYFRFRLNGFQNGTNSTCELVPLQEPESPIPSWELDENVKEVVLNFEMRDRFGNLSQYTRRIPVQQSSSADPSQ